MPASCHEPTFRGTDVTEYRADSGAASVRLDVEGPDDVAPLLGLAGDELTEVARRAHHHCATQVGKPHLDLGVGEARIDLPVELVDDFGRRGLWCADAVPAARLISRHELSASRNIWQSFRAHRGRYRERTQLAVPDVLD